MNVLILGVGVIGTVYGAHLAAGGHHVSVLAHGRRTAEVELHGLQAHDVLGGGRVRSKVTVVPDAGHDSFDVVLVAVRREQLPGASNALRALPGQPAVIFFGNNPAGRAALPLGLPGHVHLGFPGIGGTVVDGEARYVRIPQQPTAFQSASEARVAEVQTTLQQQGFAVQQVDDMDGWLMYHALFVSCIAAALYRCGTDPTALADDRVTLKLMCRAITEGFSALRSLGVAGLPRNLAVLHSSLLQPVAVRYWARTMRSPMGDLCFAAHARHAQTEMQALAKEVMTRIGERSRASALGLLLAP